MLHEFPPKAISLFLSFILFFTSYGRRYIYLENSQIIIAAPPPFLSPFARRTTTDFSQLSRESPPSSNFHTMIR